MKRLLFSALLVLPLATNAKAASYGLGIASSKAPALSFQMKDSPTRAFHVTSHYDANDVSLSADYQSLYSPSFGQDINYRLALYSGVGMQGEASAARTSEEIYHLRIPAGFQVDFTQVRMQTFAEATALLGPLPRTKFDTALTAGLRAQF